VRPSQRRARCSGTSGVTEDNRLAPGPREQPSKRDPMGDTRPFHLAAPLFTSDRWLANAAERRIGRARALAARCRSVRLVTPAKGRLALTAPCRYVALGMQLS
jgi:hypothetical protein